MCRIEFVRREEYVADVQQAVLRNEVLINDGIEEVNIFAVVGHGRQNISALILVLHVRKPNLNPRLSIFEMRIFVILFKLKR